MVHKHGMPTIAEEGDVTTDMGTMIALDQMNAIIKPEQASGQLEAWVYGDQDREHSLLNCSPRLDEDLEIRVCPPEECGLWHDRRKQVGASNNLQQCSAHLINSTTSRED